MSQVCFGDTEVADKREKAFEMEFFATIEKAGSVTALLMLIDAPDPMADRGRPTTGWVPCFVSTS